MAEKSKFIPDAVRPGVTILTGKVAIGATGAVTSQTPVAYSGFTAARADTGEYTLTLHKNYRDVSNVSVQVMEAGSTAYYTMPASYSSGVVTFKTGAVGGSFPADPPNPSTLLVTVVALNNGVGGV